MLISIPLDPKCKSEDLIRWNCLVRWQTESDRTSTGTPPSPGRKRNDTRMSNRDGQYRFGEQNHGVFWRRRLVLSPWKSLGSKGTVVLVGQRVWAPSRFSSRLRNLGLRVLWTGVKGTVDIVGLLTLYLHDHGLVFVFDTKSSNLKWTRQRNKRSTND